MRLIATVFFGWILTLAYAGAESPFKFRDAAEEAGLFPAAENIHAHGAGWGDVDGDSLPELFIGTFHKPETKPNLFLKNVDGKSFAAKENEGLQFSGRVTGVVFADLDNDGDLDLYVGSMPKKAGKRSPLPMQGCSLFENDGKGNLKDITKGNGACPEELGGRSVAVLDYDGDGLLDIAVAEDPIAGYNGSPTSSTRLFRNLGGLKFEDASAAAGIPKDTPGLGVAAADVNGDTLPDLYIAAQGGGNILLLNDGGRFKECPGTREQFSWPDARGDNMVCGICFGDVNRDGLTDMIVAQHFERPWLSPVANRLYLNRGVKDGVPKFENVAEQAGFVALPMKSPHVEVQDFDNDGWPDIVTSIVKFDSEGAPHPVIFRNGGVGDDGVPKLSAPALEVNDFPTDEDRAVKGTGDFFSKMITDKKITYTAPAPCADYDGDGRIDMFLGSWWKEARSLLLHNETKGGSWIRVGLDVDKPGVNRRGIGARVEVYPVGKIGDMDVLLGAKEIASGYGYASGQPPLAHFGLGDRARVDIRVILPHGKGTEDYPGLEAGQEIVLGK